MRLHDMARHSPIFFPDPPYGDVLIAGGPAGHPEQKMSVVAGGWGSLKVNSWGKGGKHVSEELVTCDFLSTATLPQVPSFSSKGLQLKGRFGSRAAQYCAGE